MKGIILVKCTPTLGFVSLMVLLVPIYLNVIHDLIQEVMKVSSMILFLLEQRNFISSRK